MTKVTGMSIARKILLVAAMFSLPMSVMLYLMVERTQSYIDFAAQEKRGDAYLRPLVSLMESVQQHHLWQQKCGSGCPERWTEAAGRVEKAFVAWEKVDREHGKALQFTDEGLAKRNRGHLRIANLRARWKAIVDGAKDADYGALIGDIKGVITHAGDTSNLILDPDLDSYYLMDVVLLALPQTQERVAKIVEFGFGALKPGQAGTKQQRDMAIHAAMLREADLDRASASTMTSIQEDPNFYGVSPTLAARLKPELDQYKKGTERFLTVMGQVADHGAGVTADEFFQSGSEAWASSYAFWRASVDELDVLLDRRIADFQHSLWTGLWLFGLALAIASALAYMVARSITVPLHGLVNSLGPGATLLSVCVERIAETSRSETPDPEQTVIICGELNAHAEDMRRAVLALAAQVEGADAERTVRQAAGYVD